MNRMDDDYLSPEEYLRIIKELDENQEKDIQAKWKDFYSTTTLHGFHYIFDQTGIRKLGWLIAVLASGFLAFYLLQGIFTDYAKLKTVAISREVYAKGSMNFPTFSICPFNAVTLKDFSNESKYNKFWQFFEQYNSNFTDKEAMTELMTELLDETNTTSVLEFIERFEINLHQMMYNDVVKATKFRPCRFGKKTCNETEFRKIFPFPYDDFGMCHQFNMFQPDEEVRKIEVGDGMGMTLNIFTDEMAIENRPYHGLAVFIHPYGSPLSVASASYVPISPGTINMVFVEAEEKHLLPPPYDSRCGKRPFDYIDSRFPYTQAMCQLDCHAKYLFEESECLGLEYLYYVDKKLLCVNASQFVNNKAAINQLVEKEIPKKCLHTCPVECDTLKYTISTSQTKIGTKKTFDNIMMLPNWTRNYEETKDYVSSNIISLKVAFLDQFTTEQDLVPTVTWVSMIGSVGGTLGLCLGCSLLTVGEFLYFGFRVVLSKFRIRKSKQHMKERTFKEIGQEMNEKVEAKKNGKEKDKKNQKISKSDKNNAGFDEVHV